MVTGGGERYMASSGLINEQHRKIYGENKAIYSARYIYKGMLRSRRSSDVKHKREEKQLNINKKKKKHTQKQCGMKKSNWLRCRMQSELFWEFRELNAWMPTT